MVDISGPKYSNPTFDSGHMVFENEQSNSPTTFTNH